MAKAHSNDENWGDIRSLASWQRRQCSERIATRIFGPLKPGMSVSDAEVWAGGGIPGSHMRAFATKDHIVRTTWWNIYNHAMVMSNRDYGNAITKVRNYGFESQRPEKLFTDQEGIYQVRMNRVLGQFGRLLQVVINLDIPSLPNRHEVARASRILRVSMPIITRSLLVQRQEINRAWYDYDES